MDHKIQKLDYCTQEQKVFSPTLNLAAKSELPTASHGRAAIRENIAFNDIVGDQTGIDLKAGPEAQAVAVAHSAHDGAGGVRFAGRSVSALG